MIFSKRLAVTRREGVVMLDKEMFIAWQMRKRNKTATDAEKMWDVAIKTRRTICRLFVFVCCGMIYIYMYMYMYFLF